MSSILSIDSLKFRWPTGQRNILDIPSLSVERGEKLFLKGPSGSGKTSLLSLIGGITPATEGTVCLLGENLSAHSQSYRDKFRSDHIGFIFQQFNLLPYLSVLENITLPCKFSVIRKQKVLEKSASFVEEASRLLALIDFPMDLLATPVSELSVGQQQRVAVARALIGSPEIVIADEPTSALDADNRARFISLLLNECESVNASILFVSHDPALEVYFDRSVDLRELNLAHVSAGTGAEKGDGAVTL